MDKNILMNTAKRLTASPRGIIAADESAPTCNARFEKLGVATTEENRRAYRELLITAPDIEKYVSGYILFDETIRQSTKDGKPFTSVMKAKGVDIGIKVDQGLVDFPPLADEKITKGLEGLSDRMKEYRAMGATFAKWRAAYPVSSETPSEACMTANAKVFAGYALACQVENIVPIVEPEILITGEHSIEKCAEVTAKNLEIVFKELKSANVFIPGMILKTSMVISGLSAKDRASTAQVAEMTVKCLKEHVPADIGGIVLLSGGQGDEEATENLNAMHQLGELPWNLTFSYSRAIQNPVLKHWAENPSDVAGAQQILLNMAKNNSLASVGEYKN